MGVTLWESQEVKEDIERSQGVKMDVRGTQEVKGDIERSQGVKMDVSGSQRVKRGRQGCPRGSRGASEVSQGVKEGV